MNLPVFPRLARVTNTTLVGLCLLALFGCGPRQNTRVMAAPERTGAARSAPLSSAPIVDAAAYVRVQPLYREAILACRRKQYLGAARLLQRLASQAGLNRQAVAFVQQQRGICLQDAGLPVPRFAASLLPSPPAARPAVPVALTLDEADCGPRALLIVCEKQGIPTDLTHLRQMAGTTAAGTSLAGLARAAHQVGLQAEGVQVSREALGDIDMPALAYVNGNHFIAVLSVQGRGDDATATVHDPNSAREQTMGQERLLRLCSGYLLLTHR